MRVFTRGSGRAISPKWEFWVIVVSMPVEMLPFRRGSKKFTCEEGQTTRLKGVKEIYMGMVRPLDYFERSRESRNLHEGVHSCH